MVDIGSLIYYVFMCERLNAKPFDIGILLDYAPSAHWLSYFKQEKLNSWPYVTLAIFTNHRYMPDIHYCTRICSTHGLYRQMGLCKDDF